MKHFFSKNLFIVVLGVVLVALMTPRLSADENSSEEGDVIDMVAGDIQSVAVNNLTRVSVTDPDVADISDAQSNKVTLLAKKAGETVLFLWDEAGKRSIKVRVANEDLNSLKARVQKLLDEANIKGVSLDENLDIGKVVLTGDLTREDKDRVSDVLGPYSDNVLNLTKLEKSEDLIEVDMQVVEISTTLEESLGIQWGNTPSGSAGATSSTSTGTTGNGVQLGYGEQGVPFGDKFKDLFKIGNFERTTPLQATVNALVQEGKAKLISKPRLVVVSGKEASFLVGGEIPVQNTTTSASGGVQQSSTSYTEYGVNMTVTPTIREGKIDVVLNVDIKDVDNSSSFSGNTGSTVAFITRTASTDLLMDNKQTIALAGLIKYEDSVTYNEVPFLSKVPLLGALFRSKSIPGNTSTEMVIILTPTVLTNKKIADSQIVMPTPGERAAWNEIDSKYEHEPLPTWPLPKEAPPTAPNNSNNSLNLPAAPVNTVVYAHNDAATQSDNNSGDLTTYARMVQEKISKAISYPHATMGVVLSGTVKLKLHILKNGSLDSEEVLESSGNDILDQDAMQAAKTAAPYDAFTTGMDQQDMIFTIPIVYNKLISQR